MTSLLSNDELDDMVDEWHDNEQDMPTSLEDFIRANTGWSHDEYNVWAISGRQPNG